MKIIYYYATPGMLLYAKVSFGSEFQGTDVIDRQVIGTQYVMLGSK